MIVIFKRVYLFFTLQRSGGVWSPHRAHNPGIAWFKSRLRYFKMKLIGIDDAGRGPIIGPMVLAGVLIEKDDEAKLRGWGVKDSKLLTPKKREEIARKIEKNFKTHVELTFPDEIDSRTKMANLNFIEAVKAGMIVNKLMQNVDEKVKVVIDCPSVNIKVWGGQVRKFIDKKEFVEICCEHKADVNHVVVGAGSIVAKVRRDAEIEKIKEKWGEIGSGYPSDPVTKKFLKDNFEKLVESGIVRETWGTWKNLKNNRGQRRLF